jgi:uncharacterized protein (UPF0147 family)
MLCLSDSQPDSARPKNVLGPIAASTSVLDALNRPEQRSWTHLAVALHPHETVSNLKNVPGPIRGSLRSLVTDDVYPNNVRRPIGNSLQALIESCQPEKCSWTYHAVALRPHQTVPNLKMFLDLSEDRSARWPQTMHTQIMFADLSGSHSKPLIESCQPEKYSWSYPELSGTVVRLGHCRAGD